MKPTVLVIDDEESIRYTFDAFLGNAGYDVDTADTFEKGVERIAERSYDIILADIILGGHTGVDLLREVKTRGLHAPVILITGEPNMETATAALRLGAHDYIPKPVTKTMLLNLVRRALTFKEFKDASERYRTHLDTIFQSVSEGIVMVDRDMIVLEVNGAVERMCNISREHIGRDFRLLEKQCGGTCASRLEEALSGNATVEAYRIECRGDRPRVVTLSASPLRHATGACLGAVMTIKDETRLDLLERASRERRRFHNLVGRSRPMQDIYRLIDDLSSLPTTVLLTGESGTGKELVAEALHFQGRRHEGPLVKVNCSTLPETLLESELFGHIKGSFTGAVAGRAGRFEQADGGTIFLDEIGDVPPAVQVKLLRVLQERQFERVGSSSPINVDVRVIAATNADLRRRIAEGTFREDLYYRLKVMELRLPPLRERTEDIPLLVDHLLGRIGERLGRTISGVSDAVMERFMDDSWPGNVRELEHTLEHGAVVCRNGVISMDHLPREFRSGVQDAGDVTVAASGLPPGTDERGLLAASLRKAGWNKSKAARLLGMSVRTLYRKIEKYGIREDE